MGTGGDFGYDATVGGENVNLGGDGIAQNMDAVFDNGSTSIIAARFDTEDFHEKYYTI